MARVIYTEEHYYTIIWYFHKLENNTISNIASKVGMGYTAVSYRITSYLDSGVNYSYLVRQYVTLESFLNYFKK